MHIDNSFHIKFYKLVIKALVLHKLNQFAAIYLICNLKTIGKENGVVVEITGIFTVL